MNIGTCTQKKEQAAQQIQMMTYLEDIIKLRNVISISIIRMSCTKNSDKYARRFETLCSKLHIFTLRNKNYGDLIDVLRTIVKKNSCDTLLVDQLNMTLTQWLSESRHLRDFDDIRNAVSSLNYMMNFPVSKAITIAIDSYLRNT